MDERLAFNHCAVTVAGLRIPAGSRSGGTSTPTTAEAETACASERRDWAFLGLLTFTALLFFRPQDMLPALAPLHLAEVTALGALGALVFGRLSRGLTVTRMPAELAGVAAFGAVILITAPFSFWMGGAIGTFMDLYIKVLLIFVLMANTLISVRRLEQFTWIIVSALGYLAFRAVFDYARGVNLIANGRVQGAVGGIFQNPNDLALNLIAILPLAISLALRPGSPMRRAFGFLCALLMVAATVATQSRAGTLGLVLIGALYAVHLLRRRPGLVFAGALVLATAMPLLPQSYVTRVWSITNPSLDDSGSREARRTLLREAAAAFVAHPLTGVGAGQFKNYNPEGREEAWREAHNVVLQVAAELGVLGLLCFGFLVARGFIAPLQARRLLRRLKRSAGSRDRGVPPLPEQHRAALDAHQAAIGMSIAGWFVCALFGSVAYNWTFYYLLGMAIAPREVLLEHIKAGMHRGRVGEPMARRAVK